MHEAQVGQVWFPSGSSVPKPTILTPFPYIFYPQPLTTHPSTSELPPKPLYPHPKTAICLAAEIDEDSTIILSPSMGVERGCCLYGHPSCPVYTLVWVVPPESSGLCRPLLSKVRGCLFGRWMEGDREREPAQRSLFSQAVH